MPVFPTRCTARASTTFGDQVSLSRRAGREMQARVASDAPSKPFLGERIGHRIRAQSGLDVRETGPTLSCAARAPLYAVSVSPCTMTIAGLIRSIAARSSIRRWSCDAPMDGRRRELGKLDVASNAELGKCAPDRDAMLAAVDEHSSQSIVARQSAHDRRQLDALRARAGDDEHDGRRAIAIASPIAALPSDERALARHDASASRACTGDHSRAMEGIGTR